MRAQKNRTGEFLDKMEELKRDALIRFATPCALRERQRKRVRQCSIFRRHPHHDGAAVVQVPLETLSKHWLLDMPGLRSVMTQDRFFTILLFLHMADNSVAIAQGEPGHDRAYKIRPTMIWSLVAAWQASYNIEKVVSNDECMIAFKGHVFMLQ